MWDYGFTARLCRPYRAKTKGKIELVVHYVKYNFLYGILFQSIDDLNNQAINWLKKVNNQPHGTTHEIPAIRLLTEELTPFTTFPSYIISTKYERKISKNGYISLYGNRYSVPWQYANQQAEVELKENDVIIKVRGVTIGIHQLIEGKYRVSRQKEHFEGLLIAVRNDPVQRSIRSVNKDWKPEECFVEKRTLDEYDLYLEEDDDNSSPRKGPSKSDQPETEYYRCNS